MGDIGRLGEYLLRVFDDGTVVVPLALLVATLVGVAHGMAPGHGKSLAAAFLIGSRAGYRHAFGLAAGVATVHTASVLALGLLWWATLGNEQLQIGAVTTWIQFFVAMVVVAIGTVLTRSRWRERKSSHRHHHSEHGPASAGGMLSRTGLVGIASAGALVPSPSAFLVLVSGLVTGRAGLAVAMVLAFGIGLAAAVLGAACVALAGRDWISTHGRSSRRIAAAVRLAPLVSSAAVICVGSVLAALAATQLITV